MDGEGRRAPRVLIVDDSEDSREVLRLRFGATGYETTCASDGAEALKLVADSPPDVIVLDVMMPRVDGHEVARRIKGDRTLPFIPIIMQTALDEVERKVEGLSAGADDYVTKPVEFAELEARVRSMLRIKALQDALQRREAELQKANAQLRELAVCDPLTGLDNRRRLDERFHEMFEHAVRLREPLAVAMFDLDHFKQVNDDYGHRAGDEMLRQIGSVLRSSMREIDRVGRYGGEEFLVLLPGTALDAAVTFAERARLRVAAHRFSFEGRPFQATISCGVAAWPDQRLLNRDELLQAADDALYVAKRTGRDRVVRYASVEFTANVRNLNDQHGSGAPERRGDAIGQR